MDLLKLRIRVRELVFATQHVRPDRHRFVETAQNAAVSPMFVGVSEKRAEQTRMRVIRQKHQQVLSVLEGARELQHDLIQTVQKLQEHRRALVRQVFVLSAMSKALYIAQKQRIKQRVKQAQNKHKTKNTTSIQLAYN